MAAQARNSDSGCFSRFTLFLFTVTSNEGQFAYPMIVSFVFYVADADGEVFFGLFWPVFAVLWCFCLLLQEKNVKTKGTFLGGNIPYTPVSELLAHGVQL